MDNIQRQEMEDKREEERNKGEGQGLPLDREEQMLLTGKLQIIKEKGTLHVRMSWFVLIGHVS